MNDDFDLDNDQEIKNVSLNINAVKNNIPNFSSQKLCEMIVCDRYFGLDKKISVLCMQELSDRRVNGDNFDFENYIEISFKELPQLSFEMPDLRTVLNQATKKKFIK